MRAPALLLFTIQLLAVAARAGEPAAPPTTRAPDSGAAVTRALIAALDLPVRIGDSWAEAQPGLYSMRCMPEDSVLFAAMDCRSSFALGPFSAAGPEGGGLTLYSDDGVTVTRVSASRSTADAPPNCLSFQSAVSRALTKVGVTSALERTPDGIRLRAGAKDSLQLTVECQPKAQTLELSDGWVHLVPGGNCKGLDVAPRQLRALADSAMTGAVHGNFDELGTACNPPGFEVNQYAGQMMDGVMAAYATLTVEVPKAPPSWLVAQIRGGLANARAQGATLEGASRRRFGAYLDVESTSRRLGSLWSKVRAAREQGLRSGARLQSSSSAQSRKQH